MYKLSPAWVHHLSYLFFLSVCVVAKCGLQVDFKWFKAALGQRSDMTFALVVGQSWEFATPRWILCCTSQLLPLHPQTEVEDLQLSWVPRLSAPSFWESTLLRAFVPFFFSHITAHVGLSLQYFAIIVGMMSGGQSLTLFGITLKYLISQGNSVFEVEELDTPAIT